MDDPFFLSNTRIAIVGLGLMGGSLAKALKGHCAALYGVDKDPRTVQQAATLGVVEMASVDPAVVLPLADAVILAAPVSAILDYLGSLGKYCPDPATVLDMGSTKAQITQTMQALPPRFDPIGGHPMCGKEKSGLENAEARLFQGTTFAFTPLARTSSNARSFCEQLAHEIGAKALWLDAETHDRWTAATSHFPYLLANTLAASTSPEAAPLVGPGFRSTTRLALSSTSMMRDILATNRENVLITLSDFKQRLCEVEALMASGDFDALERLLVEGAERQKILTG
jgi:prephenate dehydrogenase